MQPLIRDHCLELVLDIVKDNIIHDPRYRVISEMHMEACETIQRTVENYERMEEALRRLLKVVLSQNTDVASLNYAIANAERALDAAKGA